MIRTVGELTAATAPAFRTSVTCALLEGAHRIVLDLSSTSRIDDLGRDALVRCARAVRARDATLVLTAAPDHVRDLLRCSDPPDDAQQRLGLEIVTDADQLTRNVRGANDAGRPSTGTPWPMDGRTHE